MTKPTDRKAGRPRLRVRSLGALLDADLPPREPLLEGLLKTGESAMLWAAPGVGKTWASLSIAIAVAGGGTFLHWSAPTPRRVLLVDGEMNLADLRERFVVLLAGAEGIDAEIVRQNVLIIARQDQDPDADFPDIADTEEGGGQRFVFDLARQHGADLVILDNFATLAEVEDENDASAMNPVLSFLMRLKQGSIAAILVHHSGKSGETYRGSSKLEATFEAVIGLKKTTAAIAEGGAAFDLSFTKFRGKRSEAHAETTAWLEGAPGGGLRWTFKRSEADALNQMVAALRSLEFSTQNALAAHLGISKSELSRRKQKAIALGLLKDIEWSMALKAASDCTRPTDLDDDPDTEEPDLTF